LNNAQLLECFNQGLYQEVEASALSRVSSGNERDPYLLNILGSAQIRLGRLQEAKATLQDALSISPLDAEILNNYAVLLKRLGEFDESIAQFLHAARANPSLSATFSNLGNLLWDRGDKAQASIAYAIALERGDADRVVLLKVADPLYQSGKFANCIALLEERPEALEKDIGLLTLFGNSQKALNRFALAVETYQKILTLDPLNWQNASNLAVACRNQGKLRESADQFRQAIAINSTSAELHTNLGVVLKDLGETDEAFAAYERAVALDPSLWVARSNLLFALNYEKRTTPEAYLAAAISFGNAVAERIAAPLAPKSVALQRKKPRRIGLVTGDLWAHPVCYFLYTLVSKLPSRSLDLIAYVTKPKNDNFTKRILPFFKEVRKIYDLSDRQAAELIAADEIDVLIDLAGHTAGNRLPVFQYRPAPLQITWLGYFASTGLQEMDYIVGDKVVTPKSEQSHFVEKIYQMPEVYFCYTVPVDAVPVNDLPMLTNNYVTFGCFNNLSKIGPEVRTLWAQLLKQVPTSRLFLKYKQLVDPAVREALQKDFLALGIPPERLIMEGSSHLNDYYRSYNRVDICLDPFPYPGGTTTIDAL
jgi:predicted O-linked N-acetylglucosamine transferase (SPINDLY family)